MIPKFIENNFGKRLLLIIVFIVKMLNEIREFIGIVFNCTHVSD